MTEHLLTLPENNDAAFPLVAVVGPGSLCNAAYSFVLGKWSVEDRSSFMNFKQMLPQDFQDHQIYAAVKDLEIILLSLFVNDQVPRKIFYFWYPNTLREDARIRLLFMLGQRGIFPIPDDNVLTSAFSQSGLLFTSKITTPLDELPSNSLIEKWFTLFQKHEHLAASIGLIQESFLMINRLYGQYRYYDYLELSAAFILMISGLESLFFHRSDDHADISFKFKLLGSIYYSKYVTEDFFSQFGPDAKKLTYAEIMDLLAALYNVRSKIAHGKGHGLFFGKNTKDWRKIFELLHVALVKPRDKSEFMSHIKLCLGLLEKHILALIYCSKEHLVKGAGIIKEIL